MYAICLLADTARPFYDQYIRDLPGSFEVKP